MTKRGGPKEEQSDPEKASGGRENNRNDPNENPTGLREGGWGNDEQQIRSNAGTQGRGCDQRSMVFNKGDPKVYPKGPRECGGTVTTDAILRGTQRGAEKEVGGTVTNRCDLGWGSNDNRSDPKENSKDPVERCREGD